MSVQLNDTIFRVFFTHNPHTFVKQDADSTPYARVYENNTSTAILSVNGSILQSGVSGMYCVQISVTDSNGFEFRKSYNISVFATVDGIDNGWPIASFEVDYPGIKFGTVQADVGNTASTFKTDLAEGTDDWWKDTFLVFAKSSSLAGQVKKVTAFDEGTDFITTDAFTGAPTAGDIFVLVNR